MADTNAIVLKSVRMNEKTVKFTIKAPEDAEVTTDNSKMIFVVDTSGSMWGERSERAKKSCVKIAGVRSAHYISFSNFAKYWGEGTSYLINPDGGSTDFISAYSILSDVISKCPEKDITVFFISDGKHNQGSQDQVKQAAENLGATIKLMGKSVRFRVIGVGSQADARLLLDTINIGNLEGSYYYFNEKVGNWESELDELVSVYNNSIEVVFRDKTYRLPSNGELDIYIEDHEGEYPESELIDKIMFVRERLNTLTGTPEKLAMASVGELRNELLESLDHITKDKDIGRNEKRQAKGLVNEVLALVNSAYETLADGRQFSHHQLSLIASSTRGNTKFSRITAERDARYTAIAQKEDACIAERSKRYKIKKLDLSNEAMDLRCLLSMYDPKELLRDESCMCLGVEAKRRDATKVDPTTLKVVKIGNTYGSAEYFEAREFDVKEINGVSSVKDPNGFAVNGVLPLYLSEDHWEMSEDFLLRTAGDLLTADPSQGTWRGIFFAYLITLYKLSGNDTGMGKFLYNDIRQALRLIHRKIPDVLPAVSTFIQSFESRKVVVRLDLYEFWVKVLHGADDNPEKYPEINPMVFTWIQVEKLRREKKTYDFNIVFDYNTWVKPYGGDRGIIDRLAKYLPGDVEMKTEEKEKLPDPNDYVPVWVEIKEDDRKFPDYLLEREMFILLNLDSDMEFFDLRREIVHDIMNGLAREKLRTIQKKVSSPDEEMETSIGIGLIRSAKTDYEYAYALFNYCYRGRNVGNFCFELVNKKYVKGIRMLLGETVEVEMFGSKFDLDCSHIFKDQPNITWCPRKTVQNYIKKKFYDQEWNFTSQVN